MIKKVKINNKIMDAVQYDDLCQNPTLYPIGYSAVVVEDMVLPLRGKNDSRPGVYNRGPMYKFIMPVSQEDKQEYSTTNLIDFDNVSSIKDVIEKQSALRSMERTILTTKDNIFIPNISELDSPEMIALKTAVIEKHIDLDKYEQRFGANFNNDKRLFNRNDITLTKLKSIASALDLSLTLTIADKNPDIPNPIGREIIADLTSIEGDE